MSTHLFPVALRWMLVIVLLGSWAVSIHAQAQSSLSGRLQPARFGVFGSWDATLNSAAFTGLPSIASCCPSYGSTMSSGWRAGLAYIKPMSSELSLQVRMSWESGTVNFQSLENQPIVSETGLPEEATIRHELATASSLISIEPLVGWQPVPGLNLLGGVWLGYRVSNTFTQREVLVDPIDGVFRNLSRERNVLSGDIPEALPYAASATIGASYDLPLNADRSVVLSPELLVSVSPIGVVSGLSWTQHTLRAGLVLSFVPPSIVIDPTDQELFEESLIRSSSSSASSSTSATVPFRAALVARGVSEDGRETALQELLVEEVRSYRQRPVLPLVFFDTESYDLPARYYRLTADQREQFSMDNFYNLDALTTYRHVLNIVGRRMTDDPATTITLVGSAAPKERGGTDLALERAAAVRDYLVDTWNIEEDRITVDGTVGGDRHVSLTASTPAVFDDVYSMDTVRVTSPAGIRFQSSVSSAAVRIADWRILVSRRGVVVHSERGGEPLAASVDWRVSTRPAAISRGTTELSFLLAVTDSNGVVVPTEVQRLPVREVRLTDPTARATRLDRYSLLFNDATTADLTQDQLQRIAQIRTLIPSGATVRVTGYTDAEGQDDVNLNVSQRRANNVAKALGIPVAETRGNGQRLPLYADGTPEARLYCRTVEITVENAVENSVEPSGEVRKP